MAKFTLTITSDDPDELAEMLDRMGGTDTVGEAETHSTVSLTADTKPKGRVGSRQSRKAAVETPAATPAHDPVAEAAALAALAGDVPLSAPFVNIFNPAAAPIIAAPVAMAPVAEIVPTAGPELAAGFVPPQPAGNGAHPAAGGVTLEQLKEATTAMLGRKSATQVTALLKEKTGHPTAGTLYREAPQLAPLALHILQTTP